MALSIFLCSLVIALSQASSSALMGRTVGVVGAAVALVVVAGDVAVEVAVSPSPPHPTANRTSRTVPVSPAAQRLVLAGMGRSPPALHRGEGRVPRDVLGDQSWP
jgi:hypothetical protein